MDAAELIDRIEVLSVKPGDRVVLTLGRPASIERQAKIMALLQRSLPEGVKAMVLEDGMKLSVFRPE